MNHNVFNIIEIFFYLVVDMFCYCMCFCQRFVTINSDLGIDIDFIAEHSGMKHIYAVNTFLTGNEIR